jgi:hypothetical protein
VVDTVTILVAVAVLTEGVVPVVGTELSVTVAVKVCEPAVLGNHAMENGDVPPTVPMLAPLSKNWTEAITGVTPPLGAVAVAVAVIVAPAGVIIDAMVEPLVGDVNVIVGVASAKGVASRAARGAAAAKMRRRIVFMDGPPGGRLLTCCRYGCGLRHWPG